MVARTRPEQASLVVTFSRDGEEPESMIARDGERAWAHAIALITQYEELQHGDTITVRRAEDGPDATVVRGLPRPRGAP